MSSLNLKTCCIPLTVWVTAEVVLQLGIEGPKRAQGLGLQKMDPVLLSTSASNKKRQCSVFSRLIFLLGLWRPSARPFTMWWVCKSDWVSSMECGQEVIWVSHFCSGHAQHSSDDFSGSFFFSLPSTKIFRSLRQQKTQAPSRKLEETGSLNLYLDCHLPHSQLDCKVRERHFIRLKFELVCLVIESFIQHIV